MIILRWFILFSVLFAVTSHASPYIKSQQEIQHLLEYVKLTDCQYERNGTHHTGMEAVEHIQKKYDYYLDDIKTAEDFIEYSATQSKMSGKKYKVHCKGISEQTSQDWLMKELELYRTSGKTNLNS